MKLKSIILALVIGLSSGSQTVEHLRTLLEGHTITKRLPMHEICKYRSGSQNFKIPNLNPDVSSMMVEGEHVNAGNRIGKGSFGSVYEAKFEGHDVAVKILHRSRDNDYLTEKELYVWVSLYASFPLVTPTFFDCYYDEWHLYLIMNLMEKDVRKLITMIHNGNFSEEDTIQVALKMAQSVDSLHKIKFVHYDVKPENFLVSYKKENEESYSFDVKISDFGLSTTFDETIKHCGTPSFMAPEIINRRSSTASADIYSLGISFLNLFSRKYSLDEKCTKIYDDSCSKALSLLICSTFQEQCDDKNSKNPTVYSLLTKMTDADRSKRPSSEKVVEELSQIYQNIKKTGKRISRNQSANISKSFDEEEVPPSKRICFKNSAAQQQDSEDKNQFQENGQIEVEKDIDELNKLVV